LYNKCYYVNTDLAEDKNISHNHEETLLLCLDVLYDQHLTVHFSE